MRDEHAVLEDLKQHVNEGRGIAVGFNRSELVPPLVQQMITTGEQTGNLGMVMTRVAEFYERELTRRITAMSKAIEPIMLIVMCVTEFVGESRGLGHLIVRYSSYFDTASAFAVVAFFGLLGLVTDRLIVYARTRLVHWERGVTL